MPDETKNSEAVTPTEPAVENLQPRVPADGDAQVKGGGIYMNYDAVKQPTTESTRDWINP